MFIIKKIKFFSVGLLFILLFLTMAQFASPALAEDFFNPWGTDSIKSNIQTTTGLGDKDPRSIAASVIRLVLGFLGIIAVIIILLGGFKWMTAGGNEDKVGEAKQLIMSGVIGLVIILASFALAMFVLNNLINATH